MKRFLSAGMVVVAAVALGACQMTSSPAQDAHHAPVTQQTTSSSAARESVTIDRTLVHSYHLGLDAHRRTYLLIVLNDKGVNRLNETARRGQPYDITLDGQSYAQAAQVNSGFLVLTPAASNWTERRLAELLR